LEQRGLHRLANVVEQIQSAALQAISKEDLENLHGMSVRAVRFEDCTPEHRATLRRFGAECEAAAMRLFGRRLADLDIKARLAELERISNARNLRSAVPPMLWRRRSSRLRSGSFSA
jgi:hypothetical protein